jgi:hypothetical protein
MANEAETCSTYMCNKEKNELKSQIYTVQQDAAI